MKRTIRENHFARIEQQTRRVVQQAVIAFNLKQSALLNLSHEQTTLDLQHYNQQVRDINSKFNKVPANDWASYQAADAHNKRQLNALLLNYRAVQVKTQSHFEQQLAHLRQEHAQKIELINKQYNRDIVNASPQCREATEIKERMSFMLTQEWDLAVLNAKKLYQQSVHDANQRYDHATKPPVSEPESPEDIIKRQVDNFRIIAKTIGLDGVAPCVASYVSLDPANDIYANFQPLLCYTDFLNALKDNSTLHPEVSIRSLFTLISNDVPTSDAQSIRASIETLLTQKSTHRCLFMAPHSPLEKNTLYAEIIDNSVRYTTLSPDGSMHSNTYNVTATTRGVTSSINEASLKSYIEKNTAMFVNLLYPSNSDEEQANAFAHAIETTPGFKDHVHRTIATWNQQSARLSGLNSVLLTKRHLSRATGRDYCAFETTPICEPKKLSTISPSIIKEQTALLVQAIDSAGKLKIEQELDAAQQFHTAMKQVKTVANQVILPFIAFMDASSFTPIILSRNNLIRTVLRPIIECDENEEGEPVIQQKNNQSPLFFQPINGNSATNAGIFDMVVKLKQ